MNSWGGTTKWGYATVSRAFLRYYTEIGLSYEEAFMVIHILDYMWDDSKYPFPSIATLSETSGRNAEVIRRYLRKMRSLGLLVTRAHVRGGTNEYDFTPLFDELARRQARDKALGKARKARGSEPVAETEKPLTGSYPEVVENTVEIECDTPTLNHGGTDTVSEPRTPTLSGGKEYSMNKTKTEGDELSSLREMVERANSKARAATRVPAQSPKKPEKLIRAPEEWSSADAEAFWRKRHLHHRGMRASTLTMKHRAHLKRLIAEYGGSDVERAIDYLLGQWQPLCVSLGLRGAPTVDALYGYRASVFAAIHGKAVLDAARGTQYTGNRAQGPSGVDEF